MFIFINLLSSDYVNMYVVEPNDVCVVEADPNPTGLKVGILYDVEIKNSLLHFHIFECKNEGKLSRSVYFALFMHYSLS